MAGELSGRPRWAPPLTPSAAGPPGPRSRAAGLSIVSNSALILLKLVAGAVTGSVAIITEAIHSAIDLIASIIAFFSVRQAESPADASHRYGHEKFENLAAAAEGVLILVGSGVIVYAAASSLANGPELDSLGFGIAVVAFSAVVNLGVSSYLFRRARPRSRATPRTCARTPTPRSACWWASRSCSGPGRSGWTRRSRW
jgi:cation diffusion facilitator family transporter